jgi:hypothetical protein
MGPLCTLCTGIINEVTNLAALGARAGLMHSSAEKDLLLSVLPHPYHHYLSRVAAALTVVNRVAFIAWHRHVSSPDPALLPWVFLFQDLG